MTGPSEVATTPEQVGTRISLARTFRNLGVTELATRADIDADRLVSIEKGEVCPTLTELSVLAHALKVPVASFVEDSLPNGCPKRLRGEV